MNRLDREIVNTIKIFMKDCTKDQVILAMNLIQNTVLTETQRQKIGKSWNEVVKDLKQKQKIRTSLRAQRRMDKLEKEEF